MKNIIKLIEKEKWYLHKNYFLNFRGLRENFFEIKRVKDNQKVFWSDSETWAQICLKSHNESLNKIIKKLNNYNSKYNLKAHSQEGKKNEK